MKRRNVIPRAPSTHSYDNYNHLNDRVVHIPHFNAIKETKRYTHPNMWMEFSLTKKDFMILLEYDDMILHSLTSMGIP